MSSVDEVFRQMQTFAEGEETIDSNNYCMLESDTTRKILIPEKYSIFGVESDEKSNRIKFKFPQHVNDIDLSELSLRINYRNANGEIDQNLTENKETTDDRFVTFEWVLTRKVTAYMGDVDFIVCAIKTQPDGTLTNEWNTTIATVQTLEGLEPEPVTEEETEQARDLLTQLLSVMLSVKTDSVQAVNDTKDNAITEITQTKTQAISDVQAEGQKQTEAVDAKGAQVLESIPDDYTTLEKRVDELENNMIYTLVNIENIKEFVNYYEDDIIGLQVDYENSLFKRLSGAINLTAGIDFDVFSMYGGRRKCNVADDGTIVAWYGDEDYAEDGSMGQVMVYQPKFYYKVIPLKYETIGTGFGYHLRKANYYVSEKPRAGFRLHPAFYDANGNEIDYYLTGAYEGSIWDADGGDTGTGAFLMNDEQVMTVSADKFCSIAGVKPASGLTQQLTRPNVETMAQNRGTNWHGELIKLVSAEQLLMMIELATMNFQTAIANGVISISDNIAYNCSSITGSTANLGNGTGQAIQTTNEKGGQTTTETANGKTAICWRGKENLWGNIWKSVYGINMWGNGSMGGGQPYICNDFSFAESKNSDNYEGAGFTVTNANGYISAMGYSTKCDWLFMASECTGNSSLPVGDNHYITQNLNAYRIALLGGFWNGGTAAGGFYWDLSNGVGSRSRAVGGRLVYVPTKDSTAYTAAIASWEEQMEI